MPLRLPYLDGIFYKANPWIGKSFLKNGMIIEIYYVNLQLF